MPKFMHLSHKLTADGTKCAACGARPSTDEWFDQCPC
jgi:RNA polymerase subunit RPABC4/transcription elongation factor Spt4